MEMYAKTQAATAVLPPGYAGQAPAGVQNQAPATSFMQLLSVLAQAQGAAPAQAKAAHKTQPPAQSWRSAQAQLKANALKPAQDAIEPQEEQEEQALQDPILAQLLGQIQALLTGQAQGIPPQNPQQLVQLLQQMQNRLQQILQEHGSQVAAGQLLAMLAQAPQPAGSVQPTGTAAIAPQQGEKLLTAFLSAKPQQLLQLLVPQTGQGQQGAQDIKGMLQNLLKPTNSAAGAGQQATAQGGGELQGQALPLEGTLVQKATTESAPTAQNAFGAAVQEAKKQLQQSQAQSKAGKQLDIDKLQQQVDAKSYLPTAPLVHGSAMPPAQAAPTPQAADVQVQQAISTALASGNQQLTVQLNPAGLGSVTIQLTKTAQGMLVQIITQKPETQSLLASQLGRLQESLQPLNAQVSSVETQQQFNMLSSQQNFSGQAQQQWAGRQAPAYYGEKPLQAGQNTALQPPLPQNLQKTALDTYI